MGERGLIRADGGEQRVGHALAVGPALQQLHIVSAGLEGDLRENARYRRADQDVLVPYFAADQEGGLPAGLIAALSGWTAWLQGSAS